MKTLVSVFALLLGAVPLSAQVAYLQDGHADLAIRFSAGVAERLQLAIENDNTGSAYQSNQVVLVVTERSRFELPPETPFGDAGDPLWILPQTQEDDVLFLGFSTESITPGALSGSPLLALKGIDLPGRDLAYEASFFAWQAGQFGSFDVVMDTTDGIDAADQVTLQVPSHAHFNLGFSSAGLWHVTLQAAGVVAGEAATTLGPETTFTFHVLPLNPFEQWQATNWPPSTPRQIIGAEADPDGDRITNEFEYALGLNPNSADASPILAISTRIDGGASVAEITYIRSKSASNVALEIASAETLVDPVWQSSGNVVTVQDNGATETVTVRDPSPVTSTASRFYRLRLTRLGL